MCESDLIFLARFVAAHESSPFDLDIVGGDGVVAWTTHMGSTEASEKDEIGLAHVSISKDGEVFSEKMISFVAKAVNTVTDVIG